MDPLALLQDGFKLEFTEPPRQGSPHRNAPLNPEQSALWNLEIQNLIDKGAIVKASSQTFVSTVFVIPKSSGGWRPIINLKQLNEFLVYHRFKMEGLGSVRDLIKRGDWLAKMDITDAYLNVPIFPGHQQFLHFFWDGQLAIFFSPIWPGSSALGVHQIVKASSELVTLKGPRDLLGRHFIVEFRS